jgi:hypothetical protein
MILGFVSSAYNQVSSHSEKIRSIKEKHRFFAEVKWNKVSKSKSQFYLELVDYFFETDLRFRAVVVDKSKIDNNKFGQSFDDFYYKMYYQLLTHQIDMRYKYNTYLDIKDTLSAGKVNRLRDILQTKYGTIRNFQNIRSHESELLQLADLLIGAIGYYLRGGGKVLAKNQIIERIIKHSRHQLDRSTALNNLKFNLFFIELK